MTDVVAIVVAGGGARRLGGVMKPAVTVAGVRMVDRVIAAVRQVARPIVVGPVELALPEGVARVQEDPPGGGPVAALAAALDAMPGADTVLLVAADLPLLTPDAIHALLVALPSAIAGFDGVVFIDEAGRRQWLCGAWHADRLRQRLSDYAVARGGIEGAPLRELFGSLRIAELSSDEDPPPWFDCDTTDDIRRAEEWLSR